MELFIQYIDFIWLPIALFVLHTDQRWISVAFFLSCFMMMRLQIEMLTSMGYPTGILPLIDWPVRNTAMIVYMLFYIAYIGLAYWSPRTNKHIFLAASISIFFAATITSMVIMLL